MSKKNDKRLCWNCEGNAPLHFEMCPYCGVNLKSPGQNGFNKPEESAALYSGFPSAQTNKVENGWETPQEPKIDSVTEKNEAGALLLLLPGVVFLLFGLAILLFAKDGVVTLHWNASFAYFCLVGSLPLLYLGYKSLK